MKREMNSRIALIIKAMNITPAQLADDLGVQRSGISHILNGRNKPSLDFVQRLIRRFPDISMQWLLFGEGPMFNAGGDAKAAAQPVPEPVEKPKPLIMELFADEDDEEAIQPAHFEEKIPEIPENNTQNQDNKAPERLSETDETLSPEKLKSTEEVPVSLKAPEKEVKLEEKPVVAIQDEHTILSRQNSDRKPVKIVWFYSDHTFTEFSPGSFED